MGLPLLISIIYKDNNYLSFIIPIVICLGSGVLLTIKKPENKNIYTKEGFILTGLSWIVISLVGTLPFIISKEIPSFIDAFFETVSGFTTTGASILSDVESMSNSILVWRSFTHWIGGMGILVFVLMFLPTSGGNIYILRAESTGPKINKIVSKISFTARILYIIYGSLTLLEFLFLFIGGNPFIDSLCLSFGTAGTGGFAVTNIGIAAYNIYTQVVIGVFMLLFGVNFSIFYLMFIGRFKEAIKSEELRIYFIIVFSAITLISISNIINVSCSTFNGALIIIKDAFFQVSSIITTTGFATVDFTLFNSFSQLILLLLMFIGAMAGSTGGGIKVSRISILFKSLSRNIKKMVSPRSVPTIKFDGEKVEEDVVSNILNYILIIIVCIIFGTLILSFDNAFDFKSNLTAMISSINNIGPALGDLGPLGNYSSYSALSKVVLIIAMLIGRLEIFPVLLLFSPKSWSRKF